MALRAVLRVAFGGTPTDEQKDKFAENKFNKREQTLYMTFTEKIYNIIDRTEGRYFTAKQLYGILQTRSTVERRAVVEALRALEQDNRIVYDARNNRYRKAAEGEFGKAEFQANQRGFGFLIREDGDDLFVPASKTHGAFHRDVVLYRRLSGTRDEAEIVKVLERGTTRVVGTYDKSKNARFVIPDDGRFVSDVYILPKKDLRAQNGQKVVAHILNYPQDNRNCPEGEIVEILGFPQDKDVDILSVAATYGLSQSFPDEAQRRAELVPQTVCSADLAGRRDLRGKRVFTVDGEDAKDLDDAVSVERDGEYYILGVHIADVSHYVLSEGDIDKEAFARGTSVYLPQTVFPMLPRQLSNGICSLYEGVDRLTLSCQMKIDKRGKVVDSEIFPSVIRSVHRMTYAEVQGILDGDRKPTERYADVADDIAVMGELARVLSDKRNKRGNIEFASKEVVFVQDEKGEVVDIRLAENSFSHTLIEEFMIVANETVAEFASACGLPFVYRVHAQPDRAKADVLFALLKGLGINVPRPQELHNSVLQKALMQAKQTPYFDLVNDVMLRTMQKAKYSDTNTGHFGLASGCYCHFTSPIRRYADLTVHRVLKTALAGKMTDKAVAAYEELCARSAEQSSRREKIADEAERKACDVKRCAYAARLIGQEFEAIVSGVTERGIFAELPNTVEGFVSVEQLGEMTYDPERFCLFNDALRFSLGDKVTVRVASVNRQACKIDFDVVLKGSTAK